MARGGRGGVSHSTRRVVDLTGQISTIERNNIVTLVTAITDKMHEEISSIFDSPPITPVAEDNNHNYWLSLPLLQRAEINKENIPKVPPKEIDVSYVQVHRVVEKEEDEAMSPQLAELKKEALGSFCKWQTIFLQRMREIEIREPQPPQPSPRGRGRGSFRGNFRGNDVRGSGQRAGRSGLQLPAGPPRLPSKHTDTAFASRYPPTPNTLWTMPQEKRKLYLHIVFLVALSLSEYSTNTRTLLLNVTSSLNIPLRFLQTEERRLVAAMAQAALDVSPDELLAQKAEESKGSRKSKAHINVVHTTLAPALEAGGLGTPQGSYGLSTCATAGLLGPLAEGGRSVCNLFGMNPSKPTTKMIEIFSREIQDFGLLPVHDDQPVEYIDARDKPASERRFRLVLALGGWTSEEGDVAGPWKNLSRDTENYAVRWETSSLMNLGNSLEMVIKSSAWSNAKQEIKEKTIFTSLIESKWPTPLLKISKIMDNPWSVGMVRAEKAGAVLADAIMRHKFQGERTISLVGYGLAARVIYTCLMVLAERRCFGLVESVVMMGAPVPSENRVWLTLKSVVSGRLVNVYSEHDYLLGFLCRFSNTQFGVAGLQEIHGARDVESYDAGDMARGHLGYEVAAGRILRDIGWEGAGQDAARSGKTAKQTTPTVKW